MQGVQVNPQFVFGINGQLNSCLHMTDDGKNLVYVAGHNIIMYNLDDFTQTFIPGSENMDEINFMTLSQASSRYVAFCEKAVEGRAQVTIFQTGEG